VTPKQAGFLITLLICKKNQTNDESFKMNLKTVSYLSFFLGFASITICFFTSGTESDSQSHGELFGIFVGLWDPTFLIFSNRCNRYAEKQSK
tara:strand:- start:117 stop:392 length:276 start_codon:yes stop_codon:yes gene_type:complete